MYIVKSWKIIPKEIHFVGDGPSKGLTDTAGPGTAAGPLICPENGPPRAAAPTGAPPENGFPRAIPRGTRSDEFSGAVDAPNFGIPIVLSLHMMYNADRRFRWGLIKAEEKRIIF